MYKTVFNVLKCGNVNILNGVSVLPCHIAKKSQLLRTLYTQEALGIDGFLKTRSKVFTQYVGMDDKFKAKMIDFISDTNNMVFTEDLKSMVYLSESNDEDVDLVVKMIKRFNQQNLQLRFGNFIFGPIIMRMFHYLNKPNVAIQCFKDSELQGFFDQLITYQILMNLLFKNDMYNEVRDVFEFIKGKQIQGTKYPKNVIVLTMAACYKQNTAESYEYAKKLWDELLSVGHVSMRRTITYLAALALRQGDPLVALEIITGTRNPNYVTIRNIRVAALSSVGRLDDVIMLLKNVLNVDQPTDVKHTFCIDVMDVAREAVHKQDDAALKQEFDRVEKYLIEQGHVAKESLDQQLLTEIKTNGLNSAKRPFDKQSQQNYYNKSNSQQGDYPRRQRDYTFRPSLKDMD